MQNNISFLGESERERLSCRSEISFHDLLKKSVLNLCYINTHIFQIVGFNFVSSNLTNRDCEYYFKRIPLYLFKLRLHYLA